MRVFRHFLFILACLGAAGSATAGVNVRVQGPSILVNEVEVVRLRAYVGRQSPEQRAAALGPVLEVALASGKAVASPVAKEAAISVAGRQWISVTTLEAKAARQTPISLAKSWAAAINSAAALPAVQLSVRNVKAPVGGSRSVALVGSQVQFATVASSDEKVLRVTRKGSTLAIYGVSQGKGEVTVSAGGVATTLEVFVQPLAAYFPQNIVALVTGEPASTDTVQGALVAALNGDLRAVEGAQLSFKPPKVGSISHGESKTYTIRVKANGPMAYASEGLVNVTVRNTALGYRSEAELWYSNNPESVKKPQRLFVAGLDVNQPVRLLYHHMNVSSSAMIMTVEAINNTATPAKVLIIPGDAEPDRNPVTAGFEAADRFMRSWTKYSAEIVEIPPYTILPISLRRIVRNETASGLCYLRLLEGGPEQLVVRVEGRYPSVVEKKWRDAMASATPWRIAGFKKIGDLTSIPQPDTVHIYPHPFREEEVTYSVGGPYGFVRIGQRPIARQDNQGALDGNFGVTYTINANLENNTGAAADVEMVFESSAGYSAALFMIDGSLRRTPQLNPKQEAQISRFRLQPHSSRTIRITTLPLSGSAYPCTVTFRPVQPSERVTSTGNLRIKKSQ